MNSLIFYLGTFYILVGTIFLTVPIIYLELGKPKDLIRAFLNLLIGLILIIKNKTLDVSFLVIFLFLTVLVIFYLVELFLSRWYQLTDNEKKKLITFLEFKNNFLKILESIIWHLVISRNLQIFLILVAIIKIKHKKSG